MCETRRVDDGNCKEIRLYPAQQLAEMYRGIIEAKKGFESLCASLDEILNFYKEIVASTEKEWKKHNGDRVSSRRIV